jgi:hypothetical protein
LGTRRKSVTVAPPVGGYRIDHAYGETRKAAQDYLRRQHYLASDGNQGFMFAVVADDHTVAGACLVGNTMSAHQERDLVVGACLVGQSSSPDIEADLVRPGQPVLVQQIKRSHIRDEVPASAVCESKLLRRSIQHVTDYYDRPVLFVSYADPGATDTRTGMPLLGKVYQASGFFFVGRTGSRKVIRDHAGKWRSTKQGGSSLSAGTLPRAGDTFRGEVVTRDWELFTAPPALIWIASCTPSRFTQKQAAVAWRRHWQALNPARRVAAKLWVNEVQWGRDQRGGIVPLGEPKPAHQHQHQRFQPALWPGERITRTAAPAWPGYIHQGRLIFEEDLDGETVAGRSYRPAA